MQVRIDPAVWLTEQDPGLPRARLFSGHIDVLMLGTDELARYGGDLSRALAEQPGIQSEIILAWLSARALEGGPAEAADGIILCAQILGRLNACVAD